MLPGGTSGADGGTACPFGTLLWFPAGGAGENDRSCYGGCGKNERRFFCARDRRWDGGTDRICPGSIHARLSKGSSGVYKGAWEIILYIAGIWIVPQYGRSGKADGLWAGKGFGKSFRLCILCPWSRLFCGMG